MQLCKDDLETIAYQRFNKSHAKRYWGIILGGMVLIIVLGLLAQKYVSEALAIGVGAFIFALLIVWLLHYSRVQREYTKSLIDECEVNPTLTYVPEATKERVNEETTGIHPN